MGNFRSFEHQKRGPSPASPSSFARPVRPFTPILSPSLQPVSLNGKAQVEYAHHIGHSLDRFSIFPPEYDAAAHSPEEQQTDHLVQQKHPVQPLMGSIPAESAPSEMRPRLGFDFARIPLLPDPATLPSTNTGSPASLSERLRMRVVRPRPDVQPVPPPALHPFATQVMQRQERDETREQNIIPKKNNTGMPDALKAGVESLSGISMDDVQVHYNSSKPAQIEALAYTQGTEIHVGPGQEQHLAHEAWHVVQQKQGRVKPTLQMKGVAINDDQGLEKEADVMGARAISTQLRHSDTHILQCKRGSDNPIQRVTKIKTADRRTGTDLNLLTDDEITNLIDLLKNNPPVTNSTINSNNFEIKLDNETVANLLSRAESKIRSRRQVTGTFNVRGRAEAPEAPKKSFVFTDDNNLRKIAEEHDISVYPMENIDEVRRTYSKDFAELSLLIDNQGIKFYSRMMNQRGPNPNAALATGRETLSYPPTNQVTSSIRLTEPCRRGNTTTDRSAAMGGYSALNYAKAVGIHLADQHNWEWLHLIGSAIGGDNVQGNLVAGTYDMNTLMIPLEQTIVEYSNHGDVSPTNPMTVTATSKLHSTNRPTWVAESIKLEVAHGANHFWLGPITQKTDILTTMEFDVYRYIFQFMAGNV